MLILVVSEKKLSLREKVCIYMLLQRSCLLHRNCLDMSWKFRIPQNSVHLFWLVLPPFWVICFNHQTSINFVTAVFKRKRKEFHFERTHRNILVPGWDWLATFPTLGESEGHVLIGNNEIWGMSNTIGVSHLVLSFWNRSRMRPPWKKNACITEYHHLTSWIDANVKFYLEMMWAQL